MNTIDEFEPVDLKLRDSRVSLAKMKLNLFTLWQLPVSDQASLLGVTGKTVMRYKKGYPLAYRGEIKERISCLLRIHKALRVLYPYNQDFANKWVTSNNEAFNSSPPLEIMKEGLDGLRKVVSYLEWQLQN
jgi:hypothetical protein